MTIDLKNKSPVRVAGRNYANIKTTVSMSCAMHARFVAELGGETAFRSAFNNILSYAEPQDGYSLSAVVRIALDAVVAEQKRAAQLATVAA